MTNTFKKGEIVTIYNMGFKDKFFIEGKAKIISQISDNRYKVKFLNIDSTKTYERYVEGGEAQSNPHQYLLSLNKQYR